MAEAPEDVCVEQSPALGSSRASRDEAGRGGGGALPGPAPGAPVPRGRGWGTEPRQGGAGLTSCDVTSLGARLGGHWAWPSTMGRSFAPSPRGEVGAAGTPQGALSQWATAGRQQTARRVA